MQKNNQKKRNSILNFKDLVVKNKTNLGLTFFFLIIALVPAFRSHFIMHILTLAMLNISVAAAWNLFSGLTGYISFATAGIFGLGGYFMGILLKLFGWPVPVSLFLGSLLAAAAALPIGFISLKLRGVYFVVTTVTFTVLVGEIILLARGITGGSSGLYLAKWIITNKMVSYYMFLATVIGIVILSRYLFNSKIGLGLLAIRENENVSRVMGVNTTLHKLVAFFISCVFIGLMGGLYGLYIGYLFPETVFAISFSLFIILACVLGGLGTLTGPLIGAVILTLIGQSLVLVAPYSHYIVYGCLLVALVAIAPEGLVGLIRRLTRRKM